MKKWTLWLGIIIILAAAGGGAYYYYFMRDEKATAETPLAVTARAIKGDIKTSISGTGSVEANSRETVTAGKSGTIAALFFKEGDKVKKGQVLATFEDNDNYDDQIETINKNITKAKEQIADKQEEYKEAIGTENEEQTTKSIKNEIDDLESSIDDYNDQLQDIYEDQAKEVKQVIATIDGEVTTSDVSVGDEVQSNTTIAEIVDYTHLEFVTGIDELDIPNVKLKQTAQITLSAITDRTIEATVSEIAKEGTSSNGSASYSVSLLLNDIDGVLVGMSGQADITTEQSTGAVLVPVNAVVEFGGKSYVRVPGAGTGTGTGTTSGGQRSQGTQGTQDANGNEAAAAGGWQGGGGGRFQGGAGGTEAAAAGGRGGVGGGTIAAAGQGAGRNVAAADSSNQGGTASGGTTPGGTPSGDVGNGGATGTAPSGTGQGGATGSGQGAVPGGAQGGNAQGGNAAGGQGGRGGMGAQMRESLTLGGQLKEVTVGISNETYVEIKTGLAEGDSVLIPVATGAQGMGSSSTEQQTQQFGGFGGGGFGGNFPAGGGFGGGAGGGNVRTSTTTRAAGGGGTR